MQSPAIVNVLRQLAGNSGVVDWETFTQTCLFHPQLGYYTAQRKRVGHARGTDFYTAASLGPVFHRLIASAVEHLAKTTDLRVVELGAEAEQPVETTAWERFNSFESWNLGTSWPPPTLNAPAFVFANEVLDAQPFRRFEFADERWYELGVRLQDNGTLETVRLPQVSENAQAFVHGLPAQGPRAGTRLDISLSAEDLLERLCRLNSITGLIFLDYGKTLHELLETSPQGTARAYYRHTLEKNLLAHPGAQDLTCHVCWDRLEAVLARNGWSTVRMQRQERFFIEHAQEAVRAVIEHQPGAFDKERQALMAMLSPGHLGSKFQVLSALR
ncbi:MAG: SAM-dependent methyltransferase [Opitutales bacterium]